MDVAGLCACPADAAEDVRDYVAAHGFVSAFPGGRGAVRSFADAVLKARGLHARDVFQLRPPD